MKTWLPAKFHAHFPGIFQVFPGGFIDFSRHVYRVSDRKHNTEVKTLFREKASYKETEDDYNKVNENPF